MSKEALSVVDTLKLALEALEDRVSLMKWQIARDAVKEALAQPEQTLKLMPREATPEMLKAMDECSMEGYDERLYAGHAGSVYMAAWDAFYGQHCYCGDITSLGVIHRNDGPCHYPEHTSEYKRGYADAMNWKAQNHLEHLPTALTEQEPVAWKPDRSGKYLTVVYRDVIPGDEVGAIVEHPKCVIMSWSNAVHDVEQLKNTTPPQRTWVEPREWRGLTDEEINDLVHNHDDFDGLWEFTDAVEAKLKEKNT